MKLIRKSIVLLIIAISTFITITPISAEHLVILTTNDTHSRIDPDFDGKGGILRRKVVFDSIRAKEKNVMAIDAGDAVQGTLYFSLFKGAIEFPLLDSLKYDINILGNHEFDNGMEAIAPYYKNLKTIKLSSNYDFSATPLAGIFQPYVIKEYDGKKIGFMGINLNPSGMIADKNFKGLTYKDVIETANATAAHLKHDLGVDYVIMISHIGYDSDIKTTPGDVNVIEASKDIDLVIGGHSHTTVDPEKKKPLYKIKNKDGKNVIVTQTGSAGKNVGVIDIDLNDLEANYHLLQIDKRYDSRINYPALQGFLKPYKHVVDSIMNHEVAISEEYMPNACLGALSNWVSDAARDITRNISGQKVDFSIMNRGGIRQPMPKGSISEGIIGSMFPFDNKLMIIELKGQQVLDAFVVMAKRQGDGVSSDLKVTYTEDGHIKKALYNGKKIKKNKIYRIATLDYLANGGDYMTPFKEGKQVFADDKKLSDRILEYVEGLSKAGKTIKSNDAERMYEVK